MYEFVKTQFTCTTQSGNKITFFRDMNAVGFERLEAFAHTEKGWAKIGQVYIRWHTVVSVVKERLGELSYNLNDWERNPRALLGIAAEMLSFQPAIAGLCTMSDLCAAFA